MRALLLTLIGCAPPVSWECTTLDPATGSTAVWSAGEMSCAAARESGYQVLDAEEGACDDAVGTSESCSCTFVTTGCGGSWND